STNFTGAGALHAIWGSGPTDLWAGGDNGLIHGQGADSSSITWTKIPVDGNLPVLSIWGASATDIWAVATLENAHYTCFQDVHYPPPYQALDACGVDYESQVLHYTGEPGGWAVVTVPYARALRGPVAFRQVTGTSATDVWIGGVYNSFNSSVFQGGDHAGMFV